MSLGYYIGKWCQTYPPMHIWCYAFVGRLFAAGFAQFVVSIFPPGGTTTWYLLLVICEHVLSTFMNTVMFVAVSAFHAKISDPVIGGTYMTVRIKQLHSYYLDADICILTAFKYVY